MAKQIELPRNRRKRLPARGPVLQWFCAYDLHGGGCQKTEWGQWYVEAPTRDLARQALALYDVDVDSSTCSCCGPDFSFHECAYPQLFGLTAEGVAFVIGYSDRQPVAVRVVRYEDFCDRLSQ